MRSALAIALALFLVACERANTQALARVNGVEISARQTPMTPATLERVIDRELLVQRALEAGLDKDAGVAEQIDNARRQVLAQAYIERTALARAKPTRDEVRAFYGENPALFAERRIYRLREAVVSAIPATLDALRAEAARAKDLDDVTSWLRLRAARVSVTTQTQAAEDLPLAFLPQLARMKPGEMAVFPTPGGASVIQLMHAEDAPLTLEQADALIEQFLAGRKRLEVAAAEVKKLREGARIEYVAQAKR